MRLADGRVLVPPTEYDPDDRRAALDEYVEVGPAGDGRGVDVGRRAACRASTTSRSRSRSRWSGPTAPTPRWCTWSTAARRTRSRVGMRVAAALAGRARRATSPTSRRGSRSPTARSPSRRRCTCRRERRAAGHRHHRADPARVRDQRRAGAEQVPARPREGKIIGAAGRRLRRGLRCRRAAPTRRRARRRRSRSRSPTPGRVTTFCVVNIPGLSELAPEIPYVSRADPARRREHPVLRADPGRRRSTRCAWACG